MPPSKTSISKTKVIRPKMPYPRGFGQISRTVSTSRAEMRRPQRLHSRSDRWRYASVTVVLQIQRYLLASLRSARLAGDDLGLTLLLRQHEVPVFDVARYDAAFANPAEAV